MKYNSKLSTYKIKKIIQCFCIDIDATKTALLLGLNRNTINRWYGIFRQEIYEHQVNQKNRLFGSIEVDESYFGAKPWLSWQTKTWSRDIKTTCLRYL